MRRRAHRLLLAGLVLTVGVVVPLLTTSAVAHTNAPAVAADASWTDPQDQNGGTADIASVSVADDSSGNISWTVTYYDEACVSNGDSLQILIDSGPGGGPLGTDYAIQLDSGRNAAVYRWTGSGFSWSGAASQSCGSVGPTGSERPRSARRSILGRGWPGFSSGSPSRR